MGPADTGLFYVADQQKLILLTEDGKLLHEAYNRPVTVATLGEL